jgi:mRNA-degrading endonuclease RelE of RelBE toxin-antitoxin system
MYQAVFSSKAKKAFLKLDKKLAKQIADAIRKLQIDPRAHGTIKLEDAPVAKYRYRVRNYRILFDISDEQKIVEVLDIRKRDEKTYA